MNLPKKICLVLLTILLSSLLFSSFASAAPPPGATQDCITPADCVKYGGQAQDYFCISNICVNKPKKFWFDAKPYLEYQQEIQVEPGVLKAETWFQNFYSQAPNAVSYLVIGPESQIPGQVYRPGGALGGVLGLITLLYTNPPASGIEYLADLGKNFGIVSPAYAQQGVGFKSLAPILSIWKVCRNITYLAFVIIFIVTGLAIMFRVKISPQAVLTIESALPKLIVALIVITFSYAIVGFLIDLIYVLVGIIIAVLEDQGLLIPPGKAAAVFQNPSLLTLFGEYLGSGRRFATGLASSIEQAIQIPALSALGIVKIGGAIITVVLVLALFFTCFKLFFSLLMCYIQIILGLITAPLAIMISALPGKEGSSFGWLKDILSNILVFPAVVALFLLADAIKNVTAAPGAKEALWSAPFLVPATPELVGSLLSYGLLLLAPQIPSYVKALFEPKAKVTPPMAAILGGAAAGLGLGRTGYEQLLGQEVAAAKKAALERRVLQYSQKEFGVKGEKAPELTTTAKILSKLGGGRF